MGDAAMTENGQDHSKEEGNTLLIAAGRLEAQLQSRDEIQDDSIAWSVDNLLAIVYSSLEIKLVHLSCPNRSHILSIQEKPYILQFSPEGNVLFAAFESSLTCCIWIKAGQALNQWVLRHTWTAWQGKVLDLTWLGEPRRWSSERKKRKAGRGPQFSPGNKLKEAGGLAICEGGHVILFQGRSTDTAPWQVQTCKIPFSSHKKVAKAAIGLAPNESTALLAYTLRLSSKAALPGSSAEGDALGMFFDGANDVTSIENAQSDLQDPNEGQDKIELAEIKIDIATSSSTLIYRQLSSILLTSFETPSPASVESLQNLIWFEADTHEGTDNSNPKLRLLGHFYDRGETSLQVWEAFREDVEILSNSFYKLEASKIKSSEDEREDWTVRNRQVQSCPDYLYSHCQVVPASGRLICKKIYTPNTSTLIEVPRARIEYTSIDIMQIESEEASVLPASSNAKCRPSFSPSGTLAAQIIDDKVSVVETDKSLRWSSDDALAYFPTIYSRVDFSDVARVCRVSLEEINAVCDIDENSYKHFARMLEVRAQLRSGKGLSKQARNCRLLLELLHFCRMLKEADKGEQFDCSQLWTILSHIEWLVDVTETLARQAYLLDASNSVTSPADNSNDVRMLEAVEEDKSDNDILALMTHNLPRMTLCQCILQFVKFCNWLHRVNQNKEEAKKLLIDDLKGDTVKEYDDGGQPQLWSLADNLRLAQMQIDEMILRSAIDLSQIGRFLKFYKDDSNQDEKAICTVDFSKGDRAKMARGLIESQCIHSALSLFCSDMEGKEEQEVSGRDILTKVKLSRGLPYSICLSCESKTQLPLQIDERCICGSASWWTIS